MNKINMFKLALVLNAPLALYAAYVLIRLLVGNYPGENDDGVHNSVFALIALLFVFLPMLIVASILLAFTSKYRKNKSQTLPITSLIYGILTTTYVISTIWMQNEK